MYVDFIFRTIKQLFLIYKKKMILLFCVICFIFCLETEKKGIYLKRADEELQNDKDVVLEAVKQKWIALQYVSEELRNDKDVVLEATKQKWIALKFKDVRRNF